MVYRQNVLDPYISFHVKTHNNMLSDGYLNNNYSIIVPFRERLWEQFLSSIAYYVSNEFVTIGPIN